VTPADLARLYASERGDPEGVSERMTGRLNDLRIYQRALSSDQIADLVASGSAR
jgi:hypothetical protein